MDYGDLERRMKGAISVLREEFGGLRTGRASISLLEPINVEVYGASMPMNQVATISVPESRMLSAQVWDKTNVAAVEKAIRESNLGLNPVTEGTLIAKGTLVSETRSLLIADAELRDDRDRLVGRGTGNFMKSRIQLADIPGYAD